MGEGLTSGCALALWDQTEDKVRKACLMDISKPKPLTSSKSLQVAYNYYALSVPKDTNVKVTCENPNLNTQYLIPGRTTKIIHLQGGCTGRTREGNVLTVKGKKIAKELELKWDGKDSSSMDIGFGEYSHLWHDAHNDETLKNLLRRKQSESVKEEKGLDAKDVVFYTCVTLFLALLLIWAIRKAFLRRWQR